MIKFDYTTSVGGKTKICTREDFEKITLSANVAELVRVVRAAKDAETAAEYKRRLPAFCFMAHFPKGRRLAKDAVPSGLVMLDIDHIEKPREYFSEEQLAKAKELGLVLLHVTPSGKGLRLVFHTGVVDDIAKAQLSLATSLGIKEYDTVTKDLSRLSFAVPADDILFNTLFDIPDDAAGAPPVANVEKIVDDAEAANRTFPDDYHGVKYTDIIAQMLVAMGYPEVPAVGERNIALYKLVRELRYICDFNKSFVLQVLPDWGLSKNEVEQTVTSAIASARAATIPANLQRTIARLQIATDDTADEPEASAEKIPELPEPLRAMLRPIPEDYHGAALVSLLPIIGTLATRVRFRYLDGKEQSLSFLTCLRADQASGKSFTRELVTMLLAPIQEADNVARKQERDWMEKKRRAKNAKEQPKDPEVVIRIVPPTVSNAMLFKRLDRAKGLHLFSFAEEIDTMTKGRKAGAWSQKDDLLRQAFDNSLGGQDYMSENSWSALLPIYYNLLMCGTPSAVARFFSDVEGGLVSRVCFAQFPDMRGAPMPHFDS